MPPPPTIEERAYPIRAMARAKGLVEERRYIVFADPMVNELLDAQQGEAAFWRDMERNRAREAELLRKELKVARADAVVEVGFWKRQFRAYRIWAWWWFSAAIGLAVALAFAL